MSRRLAVVVVLVLFAVPAAEAKAPPEGVKVCGARGTCVSIAQREAERMGIWHASGAVAPGAPAPYYVVRYRWRTTDPEQVSYWIPSSGLYRTVSPYLVSWFRVPRNRMEQATVGLEAAPLPRITRVTVAGRPVRAPSTYLRLFSTGRATNVWTGPTWLRIRFTATAPSPWTDASADVRIAQSGNYLLRDGTVFVIPKDLAQRVRRGLPLR